MLGRVAGQAMEICERNLSFARFPPRDHEGAHSCKHDRKIGRVGRHTGIRPTENRVIAIKAVERRTAGARASLIAAAIGLVAEIWQKVRCMMLPPIDAILRSWPDALSSSAPSRGSRPSTPTRRMGRMGELPLRCRSA